MQEPKPAQSRHERLPRPPYEAPAQTPSGGPPPGPETYPVSGAVLNGSLTLTDDGGAGRFEQKDPDDRLEFTIEISQEGFYSLDFEAKSFGGYKENAIHIDGEPAGALVTDSDGYALSPFGHAYLTEGSHAVALTAVWGWIAVKSLTVAAEAPPDGSLYYVPASLVNPDADDNALALMSYLVTTYGKASLSGQQSQGDWEGDRGLFGGEAELIYQKTGKRPAVIGLDMIDYSLSRAANGTRSREVEAAVEAWENNAIVTFCWHWNAPSPYITGIWWRAFYTDATRKGFFKEIMDGGDPEGYQLLLDDIDAIAEQLKRLRDAGVPVLWRPLHEASGGWFWWGTDRESYLGLYKLLYDRLTHVHHLNNLIWVWNGQHKDWYPGDEYVDIIGEDIYPGERVHASQVNKFLEAAAYTGAPKMVVLSENGCLFDPGLAVRDGALWGYWCVWNGEFVTGETYNEYATLERVYNSEYVITHDKLPDLKTYPIYLD
jgi:mannan endo-1,4-beta-mannosidase